MRIGAGELLVILLIAIILFGGKRISGLGKALGTSIREFKQEMKATDKPDEKGETSGTDGTTTNGTAGK